MSEANKATIRRWVSEAWNQGNFASLPEMYAPNYIGNFSGQPEPVRGALGLQQFIQIYRAAMPDMHFTIEDLIAEGDKVTWRFTARGTQTGELMGIPPTGRKATVVGIVISRFEGGKWVEDWVNYDGLGMLQQLGVVPAAA